MENREKEIDLIALLNEIWGQRRRVIKWGIGGFIVGVVIAFSIPKQYESTIIIAPESRAQSGSMSQFGGLAAMAGINVGVASGGAGIDELVYPQIIKSTPFLSEFESIQIPYKGQQITLMQYLTKEQSGAWWNYIFGAPMQLVSWVLSSDSEQTVLDNPKNPSDEKRRFESSLAQCLLVVADKKTRLMTMTVTMQSPEAALIVADSMLAKLTRYMTDYHTVKSRGDLQTSQQSLDQARIEYYKADSLYASVIDRNQNLISKSAQIKIERYQNERNIAFMAYQQLAQQTELYKIKLQEDTPIATVIEPARMADRATSPNKKLLVIAFTLLGAFIAGGIVTTKVLVSKDLTPRQNISKKQ